MTTYNWSDIAFKDKSELKKDNLIFIVGGRDISPKRIGEIFKEFIFKGPILWGCVREEYVAGLEDQEHFRTLPFQKLQETLAKLEKFRIPNNSDILVYDQRDLNFILDKLDFHRVIFINGSLKGAFHVREEFITLARKQEKYKSISPFSDETEAKSYLEKVKSKLEKLAYFDINKIYSDEELMQLADQIAKQSFDYIGQTGCVIAKEGKVLLSAYNKIQPYDTYALHFGSVREKNFSPPNDLNHYDTIHAEMAIVTNALNKGIDLSRTTMYINLMPCPTCAKVLAETKISEFVYRIDHSNGYAFKLLNEMGKKVRRM